MKKVFSILTIICAFIVFLGFSLNAKAAELTDQEKVQAEVDGINLPSKAIIDFPVTSISVYGSTITWSSNNTSVINVPTNGGWATVTRPTDDDATVRLTVNIRLGSAEASKNFDILVPKGTTLTNSYSISYVLNEGTNNENNPTTYKVGETTALLAPTKGVLEFQGWYFTSDFAGDAVTELPKGTTGNITLYAKWADPVITSIEVTTNPTKVNYNALESFDSTGMVVTAHYNYGADTVLTNYDVDKTVLHANDTVVTVSYGNLIDTVNVTVAKLNYNLTGVTFNNDTKTYNGLAQGLVISGTLPEGLTVEYSESPVNAGTHTITATFVNSNEVDYNTPEAMTAKLTINEATLVIKANDKLIQVGHELPTFDATITGFVNNETSSVLVGTLSFNTLATAGSPAGTYDINVSGVTAANYEIRFTKGTLTISDMELNIFVDSSALSKVYNGTKQMFAAEVRSEEGTISSIELTYKVNGVVFDGATNVGTYTVVVAFDDVTYGSGSQEFTFVITKANYDMSGVSFAGATKEYNGNVQTLAISGTLPEGVSVEYSDGQKNVGSIVITASFTGDSDNYNAIPQMTATLVISPLALDVEMFTALANMEYTGSALTPAVTGEVFGEALVLDTDFTTEYTNNTEKGTATVNVTGRGNYSGTIQLTFVIGDSALEIVKQVSEYIKTTYNAVPAGTADLVVSHLGATIDWMSTSTAVAISETGEVTYIMTNEVQSVVVFALIQKGEAADYAQITITVPAVLVDTTTNVQVEGIAQDVTLEVTPVTETAPAQTSINVVNERAEVLAAYDISLTSEGVAVQPDGTVTVKLPIPAGSESDETLKVYYVNGANVTDMEATVVNGYLVFNTTHFSSYVITKDTEEDGIQTKTISEVLAAEVSTTVWYRITGIVTTIDNDGYGNFTLVDQNDPSVSIYVYGVRANKDAAKSGSQWGPLGVSENDIITIIGNRAVYNNSPQVGNAYYVSHYTPQLSETDKVAQDKASLTISETMNENTVLPVSGAKGSTITWESNNSAITISGANATVTRPTGANATVTLTATITCGDASDTKEFTVTVEKVLSDAEKVALDKGAIVFDSMTISSNLTLEILGENGTVIEWVSNNSSIISDTGVVTRPAVGEANATVTLTALFENGDAEDEATYTFTVLAQTGESEEPVEYTYDLVANFATYSSDTSTDDPKWSSSYDAHMITSTDIDSNLPEATISFTAVSKQIGTITDKPVMASKKNLVYTTFTLAEGEITDIKFNLVQWTTKTFKDIHIEYYDGTNWISCSNVITTPGELTTNITLPSNINVIRLSVTGNSTSNTQVGIQSIVVKTTSSN